MATANWTGPGLLAIAKGLVDLDTDTFKISLHTNTFAPNQDTLDFRDDLTNEVTGTGYTAAGAVLASVTVTYDTATNEVRFDAADPSWSGATIASIRKYAICKIRGGASSADECILYGVLDADNSIGGGVFSLTVDATGLGKITAL